MSIDKAKWIWGGREVKDKYNKSVVFEKDFSIKSLCSASISITADSFYRLYVNGVWVCDGPARGWPQHYYYDNADIEAYLKTGVNNIRIVARYFGCGTFHQVPQTPGVIARLELTRKTGTKTVIATDKSWRAAPAKFLIQNTPKISVQMEPAEFYDAVMENKLSFTQAREICSAHDGLWKDLKPRDVAMLSREPVSFTKFLSAEKIVDDYDIWCIPFKRLLDPTLIEANRNTHLPTAFATTIKVNKACKVEFHACENVAVEKKVYIDGKASKKGVWNLKEGLHTVLLFAGDQMSHCSDVIIKAKKNDNIELINPKRSGYGNPWALLEFREYHFIENDLNFRRLFDVKPECREKNEQFKACRDDLIKAASYDVKDFAAKIRKRAKCIPAKNMFAADSHSRFLNVRRAGKAVIDSPEALIYDTPETTLVSAPKGCEGLELVYDLGVQRCGYYNFELFAEAGVEMDIFGVEYIAESGDIQHTIANRNGVTYITKNGLNKFVSYKRRSGRYLFISFRNMKSPVKIRHFNVIESTYPVEYKGQFDCSDQQFNKIWDISARTLKLCMEDTFTDCPLYEQTLWIGDGRNEALFAYDVFGAEDISRRCIEINAQSLEHYPIAGAQVPSCWDCLIPAWGLLWGIWVWEYYWRTGDEKWLKSIWKSMLKNIDGAASMIDETGLISCDYWNFFDWTDIDASHNVVIYNSMLLVGAVNAAIDAAGVLGYKKERARLNALKSGLIDALNKYWDEERQAYPDSLHEDGKPSESVCQHTSFFAYLYGISGADKQDAIFRNMTNPPADMVRVGSPFAIMYLYEALEKGGFYGEILDSIRENYQPMLDAGATTVWESFQTGTLGFSEFPTRSHCHAWSSAPIYFFNRIVLGIRQTKPGGKEFEISPWIDGLEYARGVIAAHTGEVGVRWALEDGVLRVYYYAPKDVRLKFAQNSSMEGFKVINRRLRQ